MSEAQTPSLEPVTSEPNQPQQQGRSQDIKTRCESLRKEIHWAEVEARGLKELPWVIEPEAYPGQHAEMIAQSMLAVRALEDARMRIGKVLQYAGNGVSIYDKA